MLTAAEADQFIADDNFELPLLLKSTVATEGEQRLIYTEPSEEVFDADEEKLLLKALAAQAEHYLRFGNLDLNHITLFGFKLGLPNPHLWEIGHPLEVIADGTRFVIDRETMRVKTNSKSDFRGKILVKGEVYRGEGESAAKANFFWSTLNEQQPPQTWYPSIGGTKPRKADVGRGRKVVLSVLWTNIGFAKEPVNRSVSPVTLMQPDEFAKSVMAGYGTDSATLTGGAALRLQSHEGVRWSRRHERHFRKAATVYLHNLGLGSCPGGHDWPCANTATPPKDAGAVADYFRACAGMDSTIAKAAADRLLADLRRHTSGREAQ